MGYIVLEIGIHSLHEITGLAKIVQQPAPTMTSASDRTTSPPTS